MPKKKYAEKHFVGTHTLAEEWHRAVCNGCIRMPLNVEVGHIVASKRWNIFPLHISFEKEDIISNLALAEAI